MPREKRFCIKCEKQELDDEIHYIYHCSFFKQQRKEYLGDLTRFPVEVLFNNQKYETVFRLAKFKNYIIKVFK